MSVRRKVAFAIAAAFLLLVAVLALAPFVLRGPIETRVKNAVAANVDARVDWRDLDVGLLRTFPNLSLQLNDVSVTGIKEFDGDTLMAAPRFRLVLDLGSVLGGLRGQRPLVVRSIELQRPHAQLLVRADGRANWDILHEREPDADKSARTLDVSLKQLDIEEGVVTLENEQSDLRARIAGLNHSLNGDFSKERFTMRTRTVADSASVKFAGLPYLSNARVESDVNLDADMNAHTFTLRDNRIRL
ncbi:MAG TPA: AsmA family protein, partial [Longimicrobiales bacterium]|nr:AsmA family protein [Longimicrobiales bacterium]